MLPRKKTIAWGASKLLYFYLKNATDSQVDIIIDADKDKWGKSFSGITISSPEALSGIDLSDYDVVIFTISSTSLKSVLSRLHGYGMRLGENVFFYSDLFYRAFNDKVRSVIGRDIDHNIYTMVKSFYLNSTLPVHTTMLGNVLFLELLRDLAPSQVCVAEIGAYCGGNALLAASYMNLLGPKLPFYVIDSFEGFPELSKHDPSNMKRGDYKIECSLESVVDNFVPFDNVKVLKGFAPKIFSELDESSRYGLVLYDCDLYEPALATFDYFWDRLASGGYMLVHDYVSEPGGYVGVEKATTEFFAGTGAAVHVFWENTMALVRKP